MKLLISLLFSSMLFIQVNAQNDEHDHEDHKHEGHNHSHHHGTKNELGFALGPVYNALETEWAPGVHLHYVRFVSEKFGFGGGFETILDEHQHITASLAIAYSPINRLTFVFAPGLTSEADDFPEVRFTSHFELSYEFDIKDDIHLGPLLEAALGKGDQHYMIGLHLGFGF